MLDCSKSENETPALYCARAYVHRMIFPRSSSSVRQLRMEYITNKALTLT